MDAMTIGLTRSLFTRSFTGIPSTNQPVKTTNRNSVHKPTRKNHKPISLTNNINQQTHISRRSYCGENTGSHLNSEAASGRDFKQGNWYETSVKNSASSPRSRNN